MLRAPPVAVGAALVGVNRLVTIAATALIYLGLDLHLAEDEQASGVRIIGVVDDCVDETILL